MPSPSTSLSTLRPDIASSLMEFDLAMDRAGFIWNKVFPVIDVDASAGNFGRIPIAQLLQSPETARSSGAGYSRGNWTFEPDSYATAEYGREEPVDDRQAKMYRRYFDAEVISAQRALDAVLRNGERRVAAKVFNTTTWTGSALTTAVTIPWSTHATATPIDDVEAAVQKVWDGSGLWPNALVINRKVFRHLRRCQQIIDAIEASGAGSSAVAAVVTAQRLAECFDLDQVIVAGSGKNTANEGQSVALSQIWSNSYAMVCRVATTNDFQEPCIGRVFHWSEDGSEIGGHVETYREEQTRSDIQRVRHDVDEKRLYTQAGHLLSNIS
jgi:hypothetical protein